MKKVAKSRGGRWSPGRWHLLVRDERPRSSMYYRVCSMVWCGDEILTVRNDWQPPSGEALCKKCVAVAAGQRKPDKPGWERSLAP